MSEVIFMVPTPVNESDLTYEPRTIDGIELKKALEEVRSDEADIPMYIRGKEIRTCNKKSLQPPHDHQHVLGYFHQGEKSHVEDAIHAALEAKSDWEALPWQDRASIFLKAADLVAGP